MAENILDWFGEQNDLSGLQDWAKSQAASGQLDPAMASLAQNAPRTFAQIAPSLIQLQMQNSGVSQLQKAAAGNSSKPQSALSQYAGSGDSDPNSPVPGGVGLSAPPQPQAPSVAQQNPMAMFPAALKVAKGDPNEAMKLIQDIRGLNVPPGMGPIPAGQQYTNGTLQNIPGAMTPGQIDRDKDFADIYTPFKNTGGQAAAQSQIQSIQGVIDDLKSGKLTTGDIPARYALNNEGQPSDIGKLADPSVINASNQVAKAVLPSSKALFGARVTQGEVFRNLMANGLNPYASNGENVTNLTTLKNNLTTAQANLAKAGEYFDKNGTLAGYQGTAPGIDPAATPLNPSGATNQPNPQLQAELARRPTTRGFLKKNNQ